MKFCLYFLKAIKSALHHNHCRNSIPFTLSSEGFAFVSKHNGKIRIKTITKVGNTHKYKKKRKKKKVALDMKDKHIITEFIQRKKKKSKEDVNGLNSAFFL